MAQTNGVGCESAGKSRLVKPLEYSGSLDDIEFFEVSPVIGREYPKAQLRDLLYDENADTKLKDLALIVSQRGVVFFRGQNISLEDQKNLTLKLSQLSGAPSGHGLHVHPLYKSPDNEPVDEDGHHDKNVYVINTTSQAKLYKNMDHRLHVRDASSGWHTDLTFEVCPSDYSCLRMEKTPETGGDTIWASSYEVYNRISVPFRSFLDTLTFTASQPIFGISARNGGFEVATEPRGSPLNVGDAFKATHPVVRTNPVTGWRGVFAVGLHVANIDDVTPYEDKTIRDYFLHLITHNHDLQARLKWRKGDIAIWDNRAVYHSGTPDVGAGIRTGNRASSVGERPYFDPCSTSQSEAMKV